MTTLTPALTQMLETYNPSMPLYGRADSFELARRDVKIGFILLSDEQTLELAAVLGNEELDPEERQEAFELLFRASRAEALLAAATTTRAFESFESAWTGAQVALSVAIRRWDPRKGMRFLAYVRAILPSELEKERKEAALLDDQDWSGKAVAASIGTIVDDGHNRPWTSRYMDVQGNLKELPSRRPTLEFPEFTSVTRDAQGRIVTLEPATTTEVREVTRRVKGKTIREFKEVHVPVANPMLAWMTQRKANTMKAFKARTRNWPRKQTRSKTGYHLKEIETAGFAFRRSVLGTKFTSRLMRRLVFLKPFRPLRRDDVSPRMVQQAMRRHRTLNETAFDERKWSVGRIASIMESLAHVTSYDELLVDDEGDGTRKSDLMAAPQPEVDDYEQACERLITFGVQAGLSFRTPVAALLADNDLPEGLLKDIALVTQGQPRVTLAQIDRESTPEFDAEQLEDAQYITERLQKSGLWELALSIPTHKFLAAYHAGRPGFCTLCSRYGVRVKHAIQIMKAIDAILR